MDPDEGGPKSNRNTSKFSHLYHKYHTYQQFLFQPFLKGSWKREKWGVGKESNVTIWCRTMAIDVYLQFEHAVLE
jgi:hypothetical protein